MQNLIIFLTRHRVLLAFVLLEILCLHLIIKYNQHQNEIFIHSGSLISGWLYDKSQSVQDYLSLQKLADSLSNDNARLRTLLDRYQFDYQLQKDTVVDTIYRQEYSYIPAKVVNNEVVFWNNKFTVNRGTRHGVKPGMGVITNNGIVGVISQSTQNFSQAISLLNKSLRISATHKKSDQFGTLSWSGENLGQISLKDLPKYAKVNKGDTIVSNKHSAIFPDGIPIGVIDTFWVEKGTNFYHIEVNLFVDFGSLNRVYIVNYLQKEERDLLNERK